ncbi:unnamed protein product [Hermetia illucens]|uniref:Uncharacterized protein n=1 Tax=Hermetia illucens TaxID=343691 RepID=A0A7R8YQ28_HERIL|nr:unnamed protein product [Hermetia illucens]
METWLIDVKQLRIPRPKFASVGGSPPTQRHSRRPYEPPRDYNMSPTDGDFATGSNNRSMKLENATEELRQNLQEKL